MAYIFFFLQNLGFKLPIFNKYGGTFFFGQDNLLGGQVWAMARFNLLDGQSNLFTSLVVVQNVVPNEFQLECYYFFTSKLIIMKAM